MKIISYNINGLNAFVKNGKLDNLLSEHYADVYCLQEVKADHDKILKLLEAHPEYVYYGSVNTYKKGYAGVGTLVKSELVKKLVTVTEEVFNYNGDYTYTAGRVINVEFDDFYLVNVYVVNSGKKEDIRIDFDNQFRAFIQTLNKPVIVCGDFNVCATELDYWGNYDKALNSGPGLMEFEIDGFNKMITECKLTDTFRHLHNDERKYSWYSPMGGALKANKGWRLDYFLVSEELLNNIKNTEIWSQYQGADHSPIEIEL